MPGIGRLLEAVTGIVPYLTVNPDEAIALGCAVQAGILDGEDGMNKVLSPMQAAILRALAENQGLEDDDESEFEESNYIIYE
jgi:molecular chaperone DnaK (HSP70)